MSAGISTRLVRPISALLGVSVAFFALVIVNGYTLDILGLNVSPWLVLGLLGVELLAWLAWWRTQNFSLASDPYERLGFLIVVLGVGAYFVFPALPTWLPPSQSADSANHAMYAQTIYASGKIFSDYPAGPALIAAMLSHWLGVLPFRLIHPLGSLWLALTAGAIYGLACAMLPETRASKIIALFAVFALFVPWAYFGGLLLQVQYFWTQVAGSFFTITFILFLDEFMRVRQPSWLGGMLLCLIGLATSFQILLVVPVLTLLIALHQPIVAFARKHWRAFPLIGIALGLAFAGFFWFGNKYIPNLARFVVEGAVTEPTWQTLGGWFLIMPALGVGLGLHARFRIQVPLSFLCATLLFVILAVLAHQAQVLGSYWTNKAFFALVFPNALFATIPLAGVFARQPRFAAHGLGMLRFAGVLAFTVGWLYSPPAMTVLNEDDIQVTLWAKANLNPQQIHRIGRKDIVGSWIGTGIWAETYPENLWRDYVALGPRTYEEWRNDSEWGNYLIVTHDQHLPVDSSLRVLYQRGASAIYAKPVTPSDNFPVHAQIADLLALGDPELNARVYRAGETITFTAHIKTLHIPRDQITWRIDLRDDADQAAASTLTEPFANKFPLQRWPFDGRATQTFALAIPQNTDPGHYHLQLRLLASTGAQAITAPEDTQHEAMDLGLIKVALPPTPDLDSITHSDWRIGEMFTLLSYRLSDNPSLHPGDSLTVNLYWRDEKPTPTDYTVFVHLLNADGTLLTQHDGTPRNGRYPTSIWQPGEIIPDTITLSIPRDAPPGKYHLALGMYAFPSLHRLPIPNSSNDTLMLPTTLTIETD